MSNLTAAAVTGILKDCLFTEDEAPDGVIPEGAVLTEGVMGSFGFHPDRLEYYKEGIALLLADLPNEFQPTPDGGGGWSFLNACNDKHGTQWGEHRNIEHLLCLGIATGQAHILMPREMWGSLPGGLPYFGVIKL